MLILTETLHGYEEGEPTLWLLNKCLRDIGVGRGDYELLPIIPRDVRDPIMLAGKKPEGFGPAFQKGKYIRKEFESEIANVYSRINHLQPNVIAALGPLAAWTLLGVGGIKNIRGAVAPTSTPKLVRPFKTVVTYPPRSVQADWTLRPIFLSDLHKAKNHATSPIYNRPRREIWIEPGLDDLSVYEKKFILPASRLSIDIETKSDQITCIGFAPDPHSAIVIPFFCEGKPKNNYWPTLAQELKAWEYVRRWSKMKPALFQNGLFDMHHMWRTYGIPVPLASDDTMLAHHAMQPEMEKGLGFLGTIYTDEASWKFMHKMGSHKKDE